MRNGPVYIRSSEEGDEEDDGEDTQLALLEETERDASELDRSKVQARKALILTRAVQIASDAALLEIAKERAPDPSIFDTRAPYFWRAEISNNSLDAYFSRMMKSSLKNYAADSDAGISFQNSHNARELGLGYSLKGRFVAAGGDGVMRCLAAFYTIPGMKLGVTDTDNFIDGIKAGLVRDVSIGFYGGRSICSICGNDMWSWSGPWCPHLPGVMYEDEESGKEEMAVELIEDARLSEVSAVYDGACEGAVILKARCMSEAGQLQPELARTLEARYRIKLPGSHHSWAGVGGRKMEKKTTKNTPAEESQEERTAREAREQQAAEAEAERQRQEAERVAAAETSAREAEEARLRAETTLAQERELSNEQRAALQADLTRINDECSRLRTENERLSAENKRLAPLADMGTTYRSDLIEDTLTEGQRALGKAFATESYRALLANSTVEQIKAVRAGFSVDGDKTFKGGRQTADGEDPEAEQRQTGPVILQVPDTAFQC